MMSLPAHVLLARGQTVTPPMSPQQEQKPSWKKRSTIDEAITISDKDLEGITPAKLKAVLLQLLPGVLAELSKKDGTSVTGKDDNASVPEIQKLRTQVSQLDTRLSKSWTEQFGHLQSSIRDVMEQKVSLEEELEKKYKENIARFAKESKAIEQQMDERIKEFKQTEEQLVATMKRAMDDRISESDKKIKQFEKDAIVREEEAKERLEKVVHERLDTISITIDALVAGSIHSHNKDLHGRLRTLEIDSEQLKKRDEELQQTLEKAATGIQSLEEQQATNEESRKDSLRVLEAQLEDLQSNLSQAKEQQAKHEESRKDAQLILEAQLEDLESILSHVKEEQAKQEESRKDGQLVLEAQLEDLASKLSDTTEMLRKRDDELQGSVDSAAASIQSLEQQHAKHEENLKDGQLVMEAQLQEVENRLSDTTERLEKKDEELQETLDKTVNTAIQSLEEQLARHEESRKDGQLVLEAQLQDVDSRLSDTTGRLEKKDEELQETLDKTVNTAIQSLEEQLARHEESRKDGQLVLEAQLEDLESNLSRATEELRKKDEELQETIDKTVTIAIHSLEAQQAEQERTRKEALSVLESQLNDLEESLSDAAEILKSLEALDRRFETFKKATESRSKETEEETEALDSRIKSIEALGILKDAQLKNLEDGLGEWKRKIEDIEDRNVQLAKRSKSAFDILNTRCRENGESTTQAFKELQELSSDAKRLAELVTKETNAQKSALSTVDAQLVGVSKSLASLKNGLEQVARRPEHSESISELQTSVDHIQIGCRQIVAQVMESKEAGTETRNEVNALRDHIQKVQEEIARSAKTTSTVLNSGMKKVYDDLASVERKMKDGLGKKVEALSASIREEAARILAVEQTVSKQKSRTETRISELRQAIDALPSAIDQQGSHLKNLLDSRAEQQSSELQAFVEAKVADIKPPKDTLTKAYMDEELAVFAKKLSPRIKKVERRMEDVLSDVNHRVGGLEKILDDFEVENRKVLKDSNERNVKVEGVLKTLQERDTRVEGLIKSVQQRDVKVDNVLKEVAELKKAKKKGENVRSLIYLDSSKAKKLAGAG